MDSVKSRNRQLAGIIVIFAVICATVFLVVHFYGDDLIELVRMLERGNEAEISAWLNRQGQWQGMISVFFISILQVISIFIPGMAVQIAAGLIFGWWRAFLATYTGFVSGHMLVFSIARRLGDRIQDLIPGFRSGKMVTKINDNHSGFIIALACLIPGIPNGIIPYLAASTDMSHRKFVFAIASTCWIQILSNCIAGHFLIRGEYLFMILSLVVQVVIIVWVATHKEYVLMHVSHLKNRIYSLNRKR